MVLAGYGGDPRSAREALRHDDPVVRRLAVGALGRAGALTKADLDHALTDADAGVRRRALELAVATDLDLVPHLHDPEPTVAMTAAWALGERLETATPAVVAALAATATSHPDALVRESAVAALGALGDPVGLPAILRATTDKPAVRRRAVIALAPFDGPEVDAALQRARTDRDRQVRQAAEDLLGPGPTDGSP